MNKSNDKKEIDKCSCPLKLTEQEEKLKKFNAICRWICYSVTCFFIFQYLYIDNIKIFDIIKFLTFCFLSMIILCIIDDFIFKIQRFKWSKKDE